MDEETAKKLIRLKRYEAPPEGYFDSFLTEFHRRQRQELLRGSSLRLFMERLNTYLADPRSQGWAFAPVAAVFLFGFYFIIGMSEDSALPSMPSLANLGAQTSPDYLAVEDVAPITWRGPVTLLGDNQLIPKAETPARPHTEPFGERIRLDLSEEVYY